MHAGAGVWVVVVGAVALAVAVGVVVVVVVVGALPFPRRGMPQAETHAVAASVKALRPSAQHHYPCFEEEQLVEGHL